MGKTKTIVFAEPESTVPQELQDLIRKKGYRELRTKSLKETLLALQEQKANLLVLDASFLEEGCEFISVIKNMEKDLPVIVCAGKNTPDLESRIRQQGIFYYHIKSFGVQDLMMAISNAMNGLPG